MIDYDLIIRNATIIDGMGNSRYTGDLGIVGSRIAAVGEVTGKGTREIDGSGLVMCPGFVDAHSHADRALIKEPHFYNLIMQGITTFAGGNCGSSPAPLCTTKDQSDLKEDESGADKWKTFGEWLNSAEKIPIGANYIPLVGHNTIRQAVMGCDYKRKATTEELAAILSHVREAMQSGAFGLTTMLDPGGTSFHASREELVQAVKIAAEYGGVYSPHTRHHQNQWTTDSIDDEGYGVFFGEKGELTAGRYHGLVEAVEIARQAQAKLHIAHLTPAYSIPMPHPQHLDNALARATLEDIIDSAEQEGIDISFNVLPCEHSIGGETSLLNAVTSSSPVQEMIKDKSRQELSECLSDPDFREDLKTVFKSGAVKFGMLNPCTDPYWFDCYTVLACENPDFSDRDLGDIVRKRYSGDIIEMVYETSYDTLLDILQSDLKATWALIKDKREYGVLDVFLSHDLGIPATDTVQVYSPTSQGNVEQLYGMSPSFGNMLIHFLVTMVKEKGVLSLETAVHKLTQFSADRIFDITDRGIIKEGAYADLVLIDWNGLTDNRDFRNPAKTPDGIKYVIVNGKIACDNGVYTGEKSGSVIRKLKK